MPDIWIDYLVGERAGRTERYEGETLRIGRNPEFELCFDEMGVSWEHAELRFRDGGHWIVDQGSTNGTYVNDERAHNARLKDGDVLRFGKKGPIMRFRAAPLPGESTGQAAPPAADSAAAARPRRSRPRAPSEPDFPALSPADLADAHSDLPPAAVAAPRGFGWVHAAAVSLAVLLAAAGGLAALFYLEARDQDLLVLRERARAAELEKQLAQARTENDGALAEARTRATLAQEQQGKLEQELARVRTRAEAEAKRQAERIEGLERQLAAARTAAQAAHQRPVQPPPQPRATSGGDESDRWKAIVRELSPSVVFIATRLEGKTPDGTVVPLHCFGTGFFASREGHIITNKHVVEPWKFRPLAERMAREKIAVVPGTYQLCVWQGGARFLRGPDQLDLATGYSTITGNLQLVRVAPDKWHQGGLGGEGIRSYRYHEEGGNDDLAVLKATLRRPITPIPFGRSDGVEKLDDVLVLGFPAGPSILEAGVAETSPSTGQVRKVEQTIFVSAAMIGGNSGGPLIDREGRVIGISTRVAQGTETLGSCLRIEHAITLMQGGAW